MSVSSPTKQSDSTLRAPCRVWLATVGIVLGAPFAGFLATGGNTLLFEFPPRTPFVAHAGFSWILWLLSAVAALGLCWAVFARLELRSRTSERPGKRSALAAAFLFVAWTVAWGRFPWAASLQLHTFIFLWLSYIALVNALLEDFFGSCPLRRSPRRYALSFPLSMVFWWVFEILNRYTQNWRYRNVDSFSSTEYFLFASLSFAMVLPSMWATHELLEKSIVRVKPVGLVNISPQFSRVLLLVSVVLLFAMPILPNFLFAAMWVAPPLLVASLSSWNPGRSFSLSEVVIWAATGMWCGLFWELWNWRSVAGWEYIIPFVQRFSLFEMPITGYGGYLPFGVFCGMLIESLKK